VSTLDHYSKEFSNLDTEQKILLRNVLEAKENLEQDAHRLISTALPQIAEQNTTIEDIEKRVATAKAKLDEQSNMVQALTK
jgi:hypothetical protein